MVIAAGRDPRARSAVLHDRRRLAASRSTDPELDDLHSLCAAERSLIHEMRAWQHHQAISPASRRIRQKVRGRAKAEVREKLQALHRELKACMGDYLDDGPATRQARTAGNGRRLAGYAIGEPGAVKLKGLTAGQVHKALAEVPVSRPARSLCSGPG